MTSAAKTEVVVLTPIPADLRAGLAEDFTLVEFAAARPGLRLGVTSAMGGLTAAMMDALPDLEFVASQGVGLDKIDLAQATRRNVAVAYTPDVVTEDTAEMAIALMYATLRQMPRLDRLVREGRWPRGGVTPTRRIDGKTVGIVGLGRIGSSIARRSAGLGMEVLYTGTRDKGGPYGFVADAGSLAERADVLILSCAATPATRGLVDAAVLRRLGPAGVLINVSRGAVVVEDDLIAALTDGTILGAGLDVYENEPNIDPRFFDLQNAVLQPHVSAFTVEGRVEMVARIRSDLHAFVEGRDFIRAAG